MPIYEYRCQSCSHELEVLQKISEDELTQCPECQQPELKKLMSAVGFRLKGSGWYETDFKSANQRNLHESSDKKDGDAKKDSGDKKDGGTKQDGSGKTKESSGADKGTGKSKSDSAKSSSKKSGASNKNQSASTA